VNKDFFSGAEAQMDFYKWVLPAVGVFTSAIPELVWLLVGLMVADIIFGVAAAWAAKDVSPTRMWDGVTKKILSLGVICIAALLDIYIDLLGIDLVQVTTLFYIGPELLSIIRNAAIAGVPVPTQFTQVLRYFNQEEASKEVKAVENNSILKDRK
jgi:toxin secretion/phage lysis holin